MTLGLAFIGFVVFSVVFVLVSPDVNMPRDVSILLGVAVATIFLIAFYVVYLLRFRNL
jgi:hypothetical protein